MCGRKTGQSLRGVRKKRVGVPVCDGMKFFLSSIVLAAFCLRKKLFRLSRAEAERIPPCQEQFQKEEKGLYSARIFGKIVFNAGRFFVYEGNVVSRLWGTAGLQAAGSA